MAPFYAHIKHLKNILKDERSHWNVCNKICIEIFETKIFNIIWTFIVISYVTLFLIQATYFLYKFDLQYFIKYGPSYFLLLYMFYCTWFVPKACRTARIAIDTSSLKIECKNLGVNEKNKNILKNITIYILIWVCLAVLGSAPFALPSQEDKNFICVLDLFGKIFPKLENILTPLFRYTLVVVLYVGMTCPGSHLLYLMLNLKTQQNVFVYYLKNINVGYERTDILDFEADQKIERRLLFCLKKHIDAYSIVRYVTKQINSCVFPMQILGILFMSSVVVLCFTMEERPMEYWYWRAPILTFNTAFVLITICVTGQELENVSTQLSSLLDEVKWYHWNRGTKQLYLMFITNAAKPFKVRFSENISVNYELGVQLLKTLFSVVSIVYKLQNSQK